MLSKWQTISALPVRQHTVPTLVVSLTKLLDSGCFPNEVVHPKRVKYRGSLEGRLASLTSAKSRNLTLPCHYNKSAFQSADGVDACLEPTCNLHVWLWQLVANHSK